MSDSSEDEARLLAAEARLKERRRELGIGERAAPKPIEAPAVARAELRVVRAPAPITPEQAQERRAAEIERVRREAATPRALEHWLAACGVELRMRGQALRAELVPAELREWARGFPGSLAGASALLSGSPGGGKTCSAVWLLAELYRRGEVRGSDGYRGTHWSAPAARFVPASDLFAACFDREQRKPLEQLERAEVLVVDDWGLPYESDWVLAQLDRLIDRRWSRLLPTIVTTNLTPELPEDHARYGDTFAGRYPRIYSRLCDSSGPGVIGIDRGDLRREKL
jgi:DNA replication protein DnaC